tara:strand:- start:644 stop:862 length:219 start_codon:yes stop_codon:yes gene_type:complete
MLGGFPPIKKSKEIKKKVRNYNNNNNKSLKKTRFSSTKIDNVNLKDILSFVKIKKVSEDIITNDMIETIVSL